MVGGHTKSFGCLGYTRTLGVVLISFLEIVTANPKLCERQTRLAATGLGGVRSSENLFPCSTKAKSGSDSFGGHAKTFQQTTPSEAAEEGGL